MIKKIYFDCETTGINPYCDEIIEAYFKVYDENDNFLDDYYFRSKVNFWSYEAQAIHGISYDNMLTFPSKSQAFRDLLKWMPEHFYFITYVNKNTELGTINFDVAILENELNLLGCPFYYLKNKKRMRHPISVHDIARECSANKLFKPIMNKQTNRAKLGQEHVFHALFGYKYNAHRAQDDVNALVKIHQRLLQLQNENRNLFTWDQTNIIK